MNRENDLLPKGFFRWVIILAIIFLIAIFFGIWGWWEDRDIESPNIEKSTQIDHPLEDNHFPDLQPTNP